MKKGSILAVCAILPMYMHNKKALFPMLLAFYDCMITIGYLQQSSLLVFDHSFKRNVVLDGIELNFCKQTSIHEDGKIGPD